jgi:integrase
VSTRILTDHRPLIIVLRRAGLRISDALALRGKDVDFVETQVPIPTHLEQHPDALAGLDVVGDK